MLNRRNLLVGGALGGGLLLPATLSSWAKTGSTDPLKGGERPADWPDWAESPASIEGRAKALRARARDIREFGAVLDGIADDSDALGKAIESGAEAVVIPGPLRLLRPIRISRAFGIFGLGPGPHLLWDAPEIGTALLVSPEGDDPGKFVSGVIIDGLHAKAGSNQLKQGQRKRGHLLLASNVRRLCVLRCTTKDMGLARVSHLKGKPKIYDRTSGSATADPAVLAGFSPTSIDDLNEDITVIGNSVDNGVYQGSILRFNFSRRVVAWKNQGNFANISWWGGGARRQQGGALRFLRRVDSAYIADNSIRGANGGVYGNNGRNVIVARNTISDTTDVGVDFEGCVDCTAYDNHVRDAGNFCYATFYAAKNIRFLRNYGEQTGAGATMHEKLGGTRYGNPAGLSLVALRSAGFRQAGEEAVDIIFAENELVFSGGGNFGRCTASYFTKVAFQRNRLRNVLCDWRYENTDALYLEDNLLAFDRAPTVPVSIIAASAQTTVIRNNKVTVPGRMPPQSLAIVYQVRTKKVDTLIEGNSFEVSAGKPPPIGIDDPKGSFSGRITVRKNLAGGLLASNATDRIVSDAGTIGKLDFPAPRHPKAGAAG